MRAPYPSVPFTFVRSVVAGRATYGDGSNSPVKHSNIGVAAASYWLIGGSPRINSMVRSILDVV